ncbi:hypothetical protein F4775DRAFT_553676 [Biscogniauxia sp. FL1348]|nr:hypothetical protein F4775DRAFT_553676 [Biscogniauxia sp. FL1348]
MDLNLSLLYPSLCVVPSSTAYLPSYSHTHRSQAPWPSNEVTTFPVRMPPFTLPSIRSIKPIHSIHRKYLLSTLSFQVKYIPSSKWTT